MKITFKKEKRSGGYRQVGAKGLDLRINGEDAVYIRQAEERGWYWYGFSANTLAQGLKFATMDEAKEHARQFVKLRAGTFTQKA